MSAFEAAVRRVSTSFTDRNGLHRSDSVDNGAVVPQEEIVERVWVAVGSEAALRHVLEAGLGRDDEPTEGWPGVPATLMVEPSRSGCAIELTAWAPAGSELALQVRVRMRHALERLGAELEQGDPFVVDLTEPDDWLAAPA